ncbi:hypothetical protein POM88_042750 [Heracleum sosnowskyi]|uniref:Uncharacterized protein n=1 Tax=Heracleum sosnowskyi TaxID=360622 RepID=A0AAD8MBX1_9APIA|nr:hypothetical protein POM88_042750 [Heracleum sosnowskyi]
MLIEAFMRSYRSKKTEKVVRFRNQEEENKDDDWIGVSSQPDLKIKRSDVLELTSKFEKVLELISKVEKVLEEEERVFGGCIHKPQIIENYVNPLDEKEDDVGETEHGDQDFDQDSKTDNLELPAISTEEEVPDLNQQEGGTYAPEKDDLELPAISTEEEVPDLNQQEGGISAPEKNRIKKGSTLTWSQQKKMHNYAEERRNLFKDLEERKAELKRRHYEDEVKLKKEFAEELAHLVEKYSCIG